MSNNLKEIEEIRHILGVCEYTHKDGKCWYADKYAELKKGGVDEHSVERQLGMEQVGAILTLINQKEKEAEVRALESLLDGSAEGATCICESAGLSVCDHNWSLCNVVRDRIKQLKEELKGGEQ